MQTVEQTRRMRLEILVKEHQSMASLCEKLGLARNETAGLARILNGNVRHERGTPYVMGGTMARDIETKLGKPVGWMDTPPSFAELHGDDDPRTKLMQVMEAMPPSLWPTAVRLLDALTQPHSNGDHGPGGNRPTGTHG